jgi:selenide,water dikinase
MTSQPVAPATRIRLTSLSHGAGCACKLGSLELAEVLRHLPAIEDPRVLVDAATRDDAAVFRLSPDRALVATVDFFTPIVDDATAWGAITAANALSDIYAMGATPLFALNLVGWPRDKVPFDLLGEVIGGARQIAAQAGCLLLGGHSIDSLEPQFGLAVIGEAHPDRLLTNAAARADDLLVLTKPLGTGILSTALKRGVILEPELDEAIRSMTTLNDGAMRAALANGVRAATDVTGFGLLGHLTNIVRASQVGAEVAFDTLPLLARTRELVEQGVFPGGTERNLAALDHVSWAPDISLAERRIAADPQTSGGLLLAVPPDRHQFLLTRLRAEATLAAATVGRITAGPVGSIQVRRRL